jgi:protein-tyrosine-phosphatase
LIIESAGFLSEGVPCPPEVREVMAPLGYDMTRHRSKAVSSGLLTSAHVLVGMTRQHSVDLSLFDPSVSSRSFTLSEVVRLGEGCPGRGVDETLTSWVDRIGAGRHRAGIFDLPLSEDVPDPIGKPMKAYLRTRDSLLRLTTRLADLLQPV